MDGELRRAVGAFPAVLVVGPRACGKTTSAARLTAETAHLDRPAQANVFRSDVDAALGEYAEPVLLDEWQDVPEVLGAVKRTVDADPRAGRFVLTGSVSAELDHASWPGTGRLVRLHMFGMTARERLGLLEPHLPIEALLRGEVTLPPDGPDLGGYLDLALAGGFPQTMQLDGADRRLWLDSYIDQLVTRDTARLNVRRDPERLRRYFQAYALNSAGTADDLTIYGAAGVDRKTHDAYEGLLRNIYVVDLLPAWTSNRLRRMTLAPKRFVVDTALMAAAARIGRADVMRDADVLGRLIETFVVGELRAALAVDVARPRMYHLRTAGGRQEVDVLIEYDGGRVYGVEIKATSTPSARDARHLFWMADELGDQFAGGVIFHTGPSRLRLRHDVVALPICSLWGAPTA